MKAVQVLLELGQVIVILSKMLYLLLIPLLIFAWLLQNIIHEFSHLSVGYITEKLKPKGFYPLPHWLNLETDEWRLWRPWELQKKPWKNAKFYFARYRTNKRSTKKYICIAPFIADKVIILSIILVFLIKFKVVVWLLPFMLTSGIDAVWFWRGYFWGSSTCDGKRWRDEHQ